LALVETLGERRERIRESHTLGGAELGKNAREQTHTSVGDAPDLLAAPGGECNALDAAVGVVLAAGYEL
jgi:hypothetical protein